MYKIDLTVGVLDPNSIPLKVRSGLSGLKKITTQLASPVLSFSSITTAGATVSWTGVTHATNYTVERATTAQFDQDLSTIYAGSGTSTSVSQMYPQKTYYYRVKAFDNTSTYQSSDYGTNSHNTLTRYSKSSTDWRAVTSTDIDAYPQMALGDIIIDGGNVDGDIYIPVGSGPTLGAGKKIWIRGGKYNLIQLDLQNVNGSSGNPVIITTYGGAPVVWKQGLRFYGGSYIRMTGKYDPVLNIGQSHLKGHDGSYAWRHRTYGFIWDNEWSSIGDSAGSGIAMDRGVHDVEFDYIEFREGGFTTFYFGTVVNNNLDFTNIKIHDCLAYCNHGEGLYGGSTAGTVGQRAIKGLRFYNNTIVYPGNDGLQFNNMEDDNLVENNVVIGSGANWRDAFEQYQDNSVSIGMRKGGTTIQKNIFWGAGEKHLNFFYIATSPNNEDGTSINIDDNIFFGGKGNIGSYFGSSTTYPMTNTPLNFRRNYYGRGQFIYPEAYLDARAVDTTQILRVALNNTTITYTGNKWDGQNNKTEFLHNQGISNTLVNGGGNTQATLAGVQFQNFLNFGDTFNYDKAEFWKPIIGEVWDNDGSAKKGQPITYTSGNYVIRNGYWYRAKQNATSVEPTVTSGWQTYWEQVWWDKTTGTPAYDPTDKTNYSPYPPLDVRLRDTQSTYQTTGIGLKDNPVVPSQSFATISVNSVTWNIVEKLPQDYNSNPGATYPIIIFFVGLGEVGTNSSLLLTNGPNKFIGNGSWNGRITVDSTIYDPIVVSVQPAAAFPNFTLQQLCIDALFNRYKTSGVSRINPDKVCMTGLSHGGWMTSGILMNSQTYADMFSAVVNVQGMKPDDWKDPGSSPATYSLIGQYKRGRWLGYEQSNDGRDIPVLAATINAANSGETPAAALNFTTSFSTGGHCCFDEWYNPANRNYPNLDGRAENIYQWMMRQTRASS